MRASLAARIAIASSLCWPCVGVAYSQAGHYYSVMILAQELFPHIKQKDAEVIAFCSQLPDEAREFDAVETALTAFRSDLWSFLGVRKRAGPQTGRMLRAQVLIHGLTGAESQALTEAAKRIYRRLMSGAPDFEREWVAPNSLPSSLRRGELAISIDPNTLCATGFALHLLGDSFSHRRLDDLSNTYEPRFGHFADNVMPDRVFYTPLPRTDCSQRGDACTQISAETSRYTAWRHYFGIRIVGPMGSPIFDNASPMKDISGLNSNAHMANGWNEAKLRKKLWDMKPSYLEYVLANFKRSAFRPLPRCHEITACAEKAELLERVPNCRTAWSIYRTVAWDEVGDAVTALNERVSSEDETTDLSFEESNSHTKTVPENCIPLAPLKRPSRQTIEPPPPAPICKEDLWRPGMSFNDDLVVYFTTGEADLNDDQVMNVQSWIQRISSNANGRFNLNVSGHADERGTPASNKELSRRRALTVNALIQPYTAELADYKTTLIPFGESKPPCTESSYECWCRSRRVVLHAE